MPATTSRVRARRFPSGDQQVAKVHTLRGEPGKPGAVGDLLRRVPSSRRRCRGEITWRSRLDRSQQPFLAPVSSSARENTKQNELLHEENSNVHKINCKEEIVVVGGVFPTFFETLTRLSSAHLCIGTSCRGENYACVWSSFRSNIPCAYVKDKKHGRIV